LITAGVGKVQVFGAVVTMKLVGHGHGHGAGGSCVMNELRVDVRGAHPSKTAKGEAAPSVVVQRWASPQERGRLVRWTAIGEDSLANGHCTENAVS
jgi:hypothetical protein